MIEKDQIPNEKKKKKKKKNYLETDGKSFLLS